MVVVGSNAVAVVDTERSRVVVEEVVVEHSNFAAAAAAARIAEQR